ncbi:MAG: PilW family protein [Rehaibacterium terrae]|uniref:PilW family protein n=1 Tax=Rehaibacterium terrae TaxID=1341696 RepID=UPI003918D32A
MLIGSGVVPRAWGMPRAVAAGFSLVELLVAIVVGLLVVLATITFIASIARANSQDIQVTRLTQEVRALSEVIVREVRRARYVSDPIGLVAQASAAAGNDLLEIRSAATNAPSNPGDCIVLAYDDPPDPPGSGGLVTRSIRLQRNGGQGQVWMNTAGNDCAGGAAISSAQVDVVDLRLRQIGGSRIDMEISARLVDPPPGLEGVTRVFRQTVYVRSGQVN